MTALDKQLNAFLAKLNTRSIVRWQPEFRLGRPLYDFLLEALQSGKLGPNQTVNALVVLFRLRALGTEPDLLEHLTRALSHDSVRVRNQAAHITIGLMRANDWRPPFVSSTVRGALDEALRLGLSKDSADLVRTFLDHGRVSVR